MRPGWRPLQSTVFVVTSQVHCAKSRLSRRRWKLLQPDPVRCTQALPLSSRCVSAFDIRLWGLQWSINHLPFPLPASEIPVHTQTFIHKRPNVAQCAPASLPLPSRTPPACSSCCACRTPDVDATMPATPHLASPRRRPTQTRKCLLRARCTRMPSLPPFSYKSIRFSPSSLTARLPVPPSFPHRVSPRAPPFIRFICSHSLSICPHHPHRPSS